ncbi:nucleoporin NUP42 [Esox lucius]|uniref:Nucleoporin NUP42 n=1 Tax=Esox lucius TaxID=8010 RepID=A0A3P8YHT7_ESOLU|nr:nucleoporin NUP42 [Esox lucius]
MTVCNFWMQGRCRYGDKCWNEHPRGGGGGTGGRSGGGGEYNSRPPQQSNRGGGGSGGGFGNRVWVNPAQKSGGNYVQPSSFSQIQVGDVWDRGGNEGGGGENSWGRGGGGRDNQVKSSNFSFAASSPNQNRFSVLSPQRSFDKAGRGGAGDDNEKHLETIQKDMEIWETSGQWVLSCYSVLKATISGFTELCPEELRLEYYNTKASGDLQGYASAVNQLVNQWRSRVQELRAMNGPTRAAMLAELDNPAPQAASGSFGSTPVTGFGSSAPTVFEIDSRAPTPAQNTTSTFSFAAPTTGVFVSASPQPAPTSFSSAGVPAFGATASTSAPSAAGFSFAAPAVSKDSSTTGFGASSLGASVSASGFSFASTATSGAGGFGGGGFAGAAPVAVSGFGKASGGFGFMAVETAVTGGAVGGLFTPQSELTADELKEFESKRFTLGQIPLRPPPAGMLVV